MIRVRPVKASALHHQDMFFFQKIEGKLDITGDIKDFGINFRKDIKAGLGFDTGQPRNCIDPLADNLALFVQATAWFEQIIHALVAA